jgi:hypothetical protein
MTKEEPKKSLKARAAYEVRELIIVVLYLTFFFCTLATYSMVLQKTYDSAMANYGEALIKALVIGKIILIGEALKVGRKFESQPLLPFSAVKAFVYTLIVFAFHIVELLVVSLFHGSGLDSAFHDVYVHSILCVQRIGATPRRGQVQIPGVQSMGNSGRLKDAVADLLCPPQVAFESAHIGPHNWRLTMNISNADSSPH